MQAVREQLQRLIDRRDKIALDGRRFAFTAPLREELIERIGAVLDGAEGAEENQEKSN